MRVLRTSYLHYEYEHTSKGKWAPATMPRILSQHHPPAQAEFWLLGAVQLHLWDGPGAATADRDCCDCRRKRESQAFVLSTCPG
jgi:hypothetical protein